MICKHQFFKIDTVEKPGATQSTRVFGIIAICAICTQTRKVWTDGIVELLRKGKKFDESSE